MVFPMNTTEVMQMGIVIERRATENPWLDWTWKCVTVLPGAVGFQKWKEIESGSGWDRFFATTLPLRLHKGETEGYRVNLSQPNPAIYVVLHNLTEEFPEPVLVTACPFEAEDNDVSGDERVDRVPMPVEILAFVGHFVDRHHIEQPFKKRKRKKYFSPSTKSDPKKR